MKKLYTLGLLVLLTSSGFAQSTYEVLVSNRSNNAVSRYDINGNYVDDFVGNGDGGLSSTEDILFHPDGSVLVSGFGNNAIKRYDGTTGSYLGNFFTGYTLTQPSKMSIGPDSLIYVTQWGGGSPAYVVRFELNGNFFDEFTDTTVNNGLGHVWDDQGNFYIATFGSGADGTVERFDAQGNSLGTFINSIQLQGPTSIWWNHNGMMVTDWSTGNLLQYDSAGAYVGLVSSATTNPEGIAHLPNGDFLTGDWGQDLVHRFDSIGNYIGPFNSDQNLGDPNSVKIRLSPTLSLPDDATQATFSVYPSVGTGPFVLTTNQDRETLTITDVQGKVIEEMIITSGVQQEWHPNDDLATGLYVVRSQQSGIAQRIVVRR